MAKPMRINVHTYIFYIHYAFNISVCVYIYMYDECIIHVYGKCSLQPILECNHGPSDFWELGSYSDLFLFMSQCEKWQKYVGRDSHSGLWPSLRGPNIRCQFFWWFFFNYFLFVCQSGARFLAICYTLEQKPVLLLNFGTKICHVHCSSIFPWCCSIFPWCSLIYPKCELSFPWSQLILPWFHAVFPA